MTIQQKSLDRLFNAGFFTGTFEGETILDGVANRIKRRYADGRIEAEVFGPECNAEYGIEGDVHFMTINYSAKLKTGGLIWKPKWSLTMFLNADDREMIRNLIGR